MKVVIEVAKQGPYKRIAEFEHVSFCPHAGDFIEIDDVSFVIRTVIFVPQKKTIVLRCREE